MVKSGFRLTLGVWFLWLSGAAYAQGVGVELQMTTAAPASGIRSMGMGGVFVTLSDPANLRNPAMLLDLPGDPARVQRHWVALGGVIDRETGADHAILSATVTAVRPGREAFLTRLVRLRSGRYAFQPPGQPLLTRRDRFDALFLGYGRCLSSRTALGLVTSTSLNRVDLFNPATGTLVSALDVKTELGFELGLRHRLTSRWTLGAGFARRDLEERTYPVDPSQVQVVDFRADIFRVGVSFAADARTLLALEYGGLEVKNRTTGEKADDRRYYLGGERYLTDWLALRVGSFGDALSLGLGYRSGGWQVDYAYVKDLNKDSAEDLLGRPVPSSDTHFVSVRRAW